MRIALVYDCLYPNTVGGAERWLRVLAEDLRSDHEVVYVTRRQWDRDAPPPIPGVESVAVAPGGSLYTRRGRRRLLPALLFAAGVLAHFARRRRSYDVVHCLSYPFLPLLAVRLALAGRRDVRLCCEWLECLSWDYWRRYGGPFLGAVGWAVQRVCVKLSPEAFAFSELVASRLEAAGIRREVHRLSGLWQDNGRAPEPVRVEGREPFVLFAGRLVPDKQVVALTEALALARRRRPGLRAAIIGDGPERPRVLERIRHLELEGVVEAPGFVGRPELERLLRRAACLTAPTIRDGYGMVVVEAAAVGTPVVVCRSPDNAATQHVLEGVNGAIAPSAEPQDIAAAILRVLDAGPRLRRGAHAWFAAHRDELSMKRSLQGVRAVYEGRAPAAPPHRETPRELASTAHRP